VFSAAINAIGNIGDKSSYPVLFTVLLLGYPSDSVPQAAASALDKIQGDYQQFLLDIIQKNAFSEKLTAFNLGAYNERFSVSDRGNLAQMALNASVDVENDVTASELRFSAVRLLTELKWNRAAHLAIKHFYRVQTDYSNGFATKDRFIEAIACLGAMESSEAAQVLSIQLGLLNSQTEQSGSFDEAVMLAAINALGNIGDKTAFDYLLYIGYLSYPDRIQSAAKEALAKLKW
jgi:HEAT repeat protein